ncbi:hypothetical protein JRQ81_007379 [Phrynocephalus forsythii]|uniref:Uncharacterized protein n=1 Tax=Phrynocephalus forsythii TaxID=171643 RepID=A0A9Q1AU67_9SAUR|nr:hypothetical protein JRQ81_007379 [Phrynocephalus forsythii]
MEEDAVREAGEGEEGAAGGDGEPRAVGEEGAEEVREPLRARWGEIGLKEEEEEEEEDDDDDDEGGVYGGDPEEDLPPLGAADLWAAEFLSGGSGLLEAGDSWIQRTFHDVLASPHHRLSFQDAPPVTVLLVERYLDEGPGTPGSSPTKTPGGGGGGGADPSSCRHPNHPHDPPPGPAGSSSYCYDVTLSDGLLQEKCHLDPALNELVHKNALRCGLQVKITQCSFLYEEKKLCYGFLCLERLEILGCSDLEEDVQEWAVSFMPLKGSRKHYLPLWNNEDPYGDLWLDTSARTKVNIEPLLVRIMHKTRLRYYGKPDTKVDVPYQLYQQETECFVMVEGAINENFDNGDIHLTVILIVSL